MLMEMCLEMGFPHPDYLLSYLNSKQIQDWVVYYNYRPFGHAPEMAQRGMIAALIAASSGQRVQLEDFLPWKSEEADAEIAPETTLAAMPGGAAAMQKLLDKVATDGANSKPQHRAGSEHAESGAEP